MLEMVSVFALRRPGLTLVLKEPFAAMFTKLEAAAVSVDWYAMPYEGRLRPLTDTGTVTAAADTATKLDCVHQ